MRLKAPETGKTWKDIDVLDQLNKFKDNIAKMLRTDDKQYRLDHMDAEWQDYLDNALLHLEVAEPPVHWTQLSDKEFFYECDKSIWRRAPLTEQ